MDVANGSSEKLRELYFVSCSAGAKEQTLLYQSLQRLNVDNYYFFEQNRAGLPHCYNQVLDRLVGTDQVVVLVHSDVWIGDILFREKISSAMRDFNIVGLVGSSHFDLNLQTPSYAWPVWPRESLSGAIEHPMGDGSALWLSFGPVPRRCVIMDGVFLALDMLKIGNLRFDPRFDFHLYDIDFCLTAHLTAKLILGTTNVYVQHQSVGDFQGPAYRAAMQRFRQKWAQPAPRNAGK